MEWLELTLLDGNPVLINLPLALSITPADDHTAITLADGSTVTVQEQIQHIGQHAKAKPLYVPSGVTI